MSLFKLQTVDESIGQLSKILSNLGRIHNAHQDHIADLTVELQISQAESERASRIIGKLNELLR